MDLRRQLRTDRRLWLMFGMVAFVLLGFVSVHVRGVEEKIGPSYFWGFVVTAPRVYEWWRVPLVIAGCAVVLAVPAAIVGWICQAIVVAIRGDLTSAKPDPPPN